MRLWSASRFGRKIQVKEYLDEVDHGDDSNGPLFRPIRNNHTGELHRSLHPSSVYRMVKRYGNLAGITDVTL